MVPIVRIAPSEAERASGTLASETLAHASRSLLTDGCIILDGVVGPSIIRDAREAFIERYGRYLDGTLDNDAQEVGGRRIMITIDLARPFDKTELFANPWVLEVLSAAFEGEFVLDAYGVVCSLPGSPMQHIHQDGGDIFPQAELNRMLPIIAATVAIPLLELNHIHGTTALWPGSHRHDTLGSDTKPDEPHVGEGSCMIWDYRLRHAGTPNRSAVPRPLLYMTYCRPWFTDHKNYQKQAALRASKAFSKKLPRNLRRLLERATPSRRRKF